jgi:hypothetical protein
MFRCLGMRRVGRWRSGRLAIKKTFCNRFPVWHEHYAGNERQLISLHQRLLRILLLCRGDAAAYYTDRDEKDTGGASTAHLQQYSGTGQGAAECADYSPDEHAPRNGDANLSGEPQNQKQLLAGYSRQYLHSPAAVLSGSGCSNRGTATIARSEHMRKLR